jgi:hypothetical protein
VRRLRRNKKSLALKSRRRDAHNRGTSIDVVRIGDVDGDRQVVAMENLRRAAEDEKDALYHASMADCLSVVGDEDRARSERSRATILRRAAQIKRDIAMKYDTTFKDERRQ